MKNDSYTMVNKVKLAEDISVCIVNLATALNRDINAAYEKYKYQYKTLFDTFKYSKPKLLSYQETLQNVLKKRNNDYRYSILNSSIYDDIMQTGDKDNDVFKRLMNLINISDSETVLICGEDANIVSYWNH